MVIDGIECYGTLEENSNFSLVFDDEEEDCIWTDGNPEDTEYVFHSWDQAVAFFKREFAHYSDLIEITAV